MPTTINQLPTVTSTEVQGGDQLPLYSSNNGDARKLSLSALLAYFKTTFTNPNFVETINVPVNGFNYSMTDSSDYQWLSLRPAGALASGTVNLPDGGSLVDGQEVLITTTETITSISWNNPSVANRYGFPTSIDREVSLKAKYSKNGNSWHRINQTMQIPILNGIFSDDSPSVRNSYPLNLQPVAQRNGVSNGFLRPADGIIQNGTGAGSDRGAINWNDVCYRVMGSNLVRVNSDGSVDTLGNVGDDGNLVTFDYSFDRLAIASGLKLWYYDGSLTQVTDIDLGNVVDMIWIDGYFMTTDGANIVVTTLTDPTSVLPTDYAASEIDPDPVLSLKKLRNEAVVINRYTIEYFRNIGGTGFPFQRIEGAQVQKGCVGTHANCVYLETLAFVGGSRNEQNGVYLAANGQAQKISTRSIDEILEGYTEAQLSKIKVEPRNDKSSQLLYIHLPDRTLVYDGAASQEMGQNVWFILSSGLGGPSKYQAQSFVYCYNRWLVGDPTSSRVGYFTDDVGTHWGNHISWEFGTQLIYNDSQGALFHELELVALTGRIDSDDDPEISTSFSRDGVKWSNDKYIKAGKEGDRTKRLRWLRQGVVKNFRTQRFKGDSQAHISFLRLEARLEPLYRVQWQIN